MRNRIPHMGAKFAENLKDMSKIKFLPWIGNHYRTTGFAGKRILALGESHYCKKSSDATEDLTRKVIADLFDPQSEHEAYKNTYTKFAEALIGRDCLSFEDKERFWNSIAFYNYVQVPMTGARVAPDGRWVETWRYFLNDRKEVKIVPIMHPSSSFSPEYWQQFLSTII